MQQFNLDKWLQDKSHKVVTRRGNPVRIICTDRKHGEDDLPIVFLEETNDGEVLVSCKSNGMHDNYTEYPSQHDLFFADEEELTDFESKLFSVISEVWQNYMLGREIDIAETVKEYSSELLDLARMDLEKDNVIFDKDTHLKICEQYYYNGKKNALKDFPKWKKITDKTDLSLTLSNGDYYLPLEDLETLPKEE